MREVLTELPRLYKKAIMITLDLSCIWLCFFAALQLRYWDMVWVSKHPYTLEIFALLAPAVTLPMLAYFGLYRSVLRYFNSVVVLTLIKAAIFASLTLYIADALLLKDLVLPRSVPVIYCLFLSAALVAVRYGMQQWLKGASFSATLQHLINAKHERLYELGKPVMIVGRGGELSEMVDILSRGRDYKPVVLVDVSAMAAGAEINTIPIVSKLDMVSAIEQFSPEELLLALPDMKRKQRQALIEELELFELPIKTMPSLEDLASGRLKVSDVRDIDIADVLGREEVASDPELLSKTVTGKTVLVTGAGGSIGSEIVRQVIKLKPAKVILLDHAEFSLYSIDREVQTALRFLQMEFPVITALQTITDMDAVFKLMQMHSVDTVYHAAAYKHVPLVEHNIAQGFYNNVWGTLAVAQAAIKAEVARFIFVSTDKAVRPTNIMGASKRLCEMALQAFNSESELSLVDASFTAMQTSIKVANKTCFTMVRFGNVLGSSGSVIPLFKQQIKTGGPVTITHPEIIRYFMSIPEAAELVLQAGAMGNGGDVFVLDMGEPVKIIDLAKRMISLSGLTVVDDTSGQGDIELVFTGLREGEKLYEELLIGENPENTEHPRIFKANEQMLSLQDLLQLLRDLQQSVNQQNFARFKQLIGSDVVGFHAA